MRHQYTLGLVLVSALTTVKGLPITNLFKRREGELKIYDHDGHEHTYQISQKATGGMSQAIHTITGNPSHLAKGPVTLLEAMLTRWYTPETIIGSESMAAAKAADVGKVGESSATGATQGAAGKSTTTTTTPTAGGRDVEGKFHANVQKQAPLVHALGANANPVAVERLHTPLKGKLDKTDNNKPEWWMIMPIVGTPFRELPLIKAALEAEGKPDKEKLITDCKNFVNSHVVPAVHASLDEWYTTIHAKSGHWFRFGDIKVSHFRWLNKDSATPKGKMIDFGTARIDPGNAKPTHETINPEAWLAFCTPGYEDKSNTPSLKTSSQKSGQSGHGQDNVVASSSTAHGNTGDAIHQVVADPQHATGAETRERSNSGGSQNSGGSGCSCGLSKCLCQ